VKRTWSHWLTQDIPCIYSTSSQGPLDNKASRDNTDSLPCWKPGACACLRWSCAPKASENCLWASSSLSACLLFPFTSGQRHAAGVLPPIVSRARGHGCGGSQTAAGCSQVRCTGL